MVRKCPVNQMWLHGWLCSVLAEPENAVGYVLLSNSYAAAGYRHLCENVEQQRKESSVKKQQDHTWIEVNNEVHTFVVDDQDHSR